MAVEGNAPSNALDLSRIQETSDGDKEFERELFSAYLEDCAGRIAALQDALARGDADTMHREAHTIKGASANVGATRLPGLALALESADVADEDGAASDLIGQVEVEFGRVKAAIEAYLSQG